jgi:hypothetical protein
MRTLVEHFNEEVTYSLAMFANIALTLSIQAYARRDWGIAWPLFLACVQMIKKERHDLAPGLATEWLRGENKVHNRIWEYVPPQQLLSLLFAAGADPARYYTGQRRAIHYFIFLRFGRTAQASQGTHFQTDVEFLSALIECGVPYDLVLWEIVACGCWEEWLEALRRHAKCDEDELSRERRSMFLEEIDEREEDAYHLLIQRRSKKTEYYYTHDDDSEVSDTESDWSEDCQHISPKASLADLSRWPEDAILQSNEDA